MNSEAGYLPLPGDQPNEHERRCAVCSERVVPTSSGWIHVHSGDATCWTGDGATAFPKDGCRACGAEVELDEWYCQPCIDAADRCRMTQGAEPCDLHAGEEVRDGLPR